MTTLRGRSIRRQEFHIGRRRSNEASGPPRRVDGSLPPAAVYAGGLRRPRRMVDANSGNLDETTSPSLC